jgi:3',5'-cyclic AMP phosphodiesterase CpdA
VSFSVAHFSDLHLGPLPQGAALHDFRAKRVLGAVSWHFRRKKLHDPNVADALRIDILNSKPDHIAFTGDGVNIASPKEFLPLLKWIELFGPADFLSYIPGNHDTYVKTAYETGLGLIEPYMRGDMRGEQPFPYVRLRRNVALIGLNSAIPRGFHSAEGRLGNAQREALRARLVELKNKGFYRLVMIHHPPAIGIATKYRSLIDAPELMAVLAEAGAELVIHGHNHRREMNWLETGASRIPIIGVPSASMASPHHPAEWNLYSITRDGGRWQTQVSMRSWQGTAQGFQTVGTFMLDEVA